MMRTMMVALIATVCCFLSLDVGSHRAQASEYQNGYVDASGYTWRDGYWWYDGQAYARTQVKQYYCQRGCNYYRWVYQYQPVAVQKTVVTEQDLSEDGWRGKLLDIAKQRDYYEGRNRKSAVEHNEFLESVRVLGMEGNFRWNGYGYEMSYAHGNQPQVASYSQMVAPQGSTIYGYREVADVYGNVDLGALYNSVLRLREQSYGNESRATSETHALVGELGDQVARVEEIRAKAQAASAVLSAASAKDKTTLLKEFWSSRPEPGASGAAVRVESARGAVRGDALAKLSVLVNQKCVSCHSATKQNGGLNLADLSVLTADQGRAVLSRITSTDQEKRMPKAPAPPLNPDEIALFYLSAYAGSGDK